MLQVKIKFQLNKMLNDLLLALIHGFEKGWRQRTSQLAKKLTRIFFNFDL